MTRLISDIEIEGSPRRNGELMFEAPWQARAFGMAIALNQSGILDGGAFSHQLRDEVEHMPGDYYMRWLSALEELLITDNLLTADELAVRRDECLVTYSDAIP